MSDEKDSSEDKKSEDSKTKGVIDAVTGLVKAVPVYQDAVQPLAQETGKALGTVGKAVNLALAPLEGMVWMYNQIKDFIQQRLAEKLKNVPFERIQTPNPNIAGPALEALRYTGHELDLREMFANLLATSLDSDTAHKAHPSFVEIIKNLSPDEAKILKYIISNKYIPIIDINIQNIEDGITRPHRLNVQTIGFHAGCANLDLVSNSLENLARLGLIEISTKLKILNHNVYFEIENHPDIKAIQLSSEERLNFDRKTILLTGFGHQFKDSCIVEKI